MKRYLYDITNRLAMFSERLDNTTLLVDKPWVLIDSNLDYHKYIFKRNQELVMSLNGQVKIGKWEYIPGANSILIDRGTDKILLNQAFFDKAVLILKIDGPNNKLFILANETIIPDLDVKNYLKAVSYRKFNVITRRLENGRTLEIYRENAGMQLRIGMRAYIDGSKPEDGKYRVPSRGQFFYLRMGRIYKITQPIIYHTIDGQTLTIEQKYSNLISLGDLVFIDNRLAGTGKYRIGYFKNIVVVNGVITKNTIFGF